MYAVYFLFLSLFSLFRFDQWEIAMTNVVVFKWFYRSEESLSQRPLTFRKHINDQMKADQREKSALLKYLNIYYIGDSINLITQWGAVFFLLEKNSYSHSVEISQNAKQRNPVCMWMLYAFFCFCYSKKKRAAKKTHTQILNASPVFNCNKIRYVEVDRKQS